MSDILREYISVVLAEKKIKDPGSGIVVVRRFDDGWKVLGLRLFGKYDLPKGKLDEGEDAFQAALRETEEEAGITALKFTWGQQKIDLRHLTIYLAETSQEGQIQQNPETGIWEHHELLWLTWDELHAKIYSYLQPAILWAREIVEKSNP